MTMVFVATIQRSCAQKLAVAVHGYQPSKRCESKQRNRLLSRVRLTNRVFNKRANDQNYSFVPCPGLIDFCAELYEMYNKIFQNVISA